MNSSARRGSQLRAAYGAETLAVPGVFNALVARQAHQAGFRALYLSGAALSAGLAAQPDTGKLSREEFVEQARYLANATPLPLIADADTGFGEASVVATTVRLYEAAGVAAIQLEDQQMPKRCGHLPGKELVATATMVAKVQAACAARLDPSTVIIARCDARSVTGWDDLIARSRAYREAGADLLFPEALESREEFARFAREVPGPFVANMTEFGRGPQLSVQELEQLGYAIVLFPVTLLRVAMGAVRGALATLRRDGHAAQLLASMQTRQELYDLLDYQPRPRDDGTHLGG